MKTYTVNDVAQMLGVDQETVRRWIRKGKLEAEGEETSQGVPKKVTEESLVTFASSNKKYSEKLAGAMGAAASAMTAVAGASGVATSSVTLAGAAAAAAAAALPFLEIGGAVVAGFNIAKAIDVARAQGIDLGDLASGIVSTAEAYQREIDEKKSQIAKLEFEIGTAREKIDRCGEYLNKIYAAIEDEKNGSDESQEA